MLLIQRPPSCSVDPPIAWRQDNAISFGIGVSSHGDYNQRTHNLRRSSHTGVIVRDFAAVAYTGFSHNESSMNGLGLCGNRLSQTISDALITTKRVKIGTVSGTGSDYTVQEISCSTFWLSLTNVHLEREAPKEL